MAPHSEPRPVPLRETLRAALAMRQAALWRGRSRRKDPDRLNAAIVPITGLPIRGSAGTPHETPIADEPF